MLKVSNLTKRFGGLVAVDAVSFDVAQGEIIGLIGPNGAGKTTLFNLLAGAFAPDSGEIVFEGHVLNGLTSADICRKGLTRTFQIPQIFTSMTVSETIMTGCMLHTRRIDQAQESARAIAQRVGLGARLDVLTPALTNAEKKRLEVARALGTNPRMLLLDEVLAGLNMSEVNALLDLIRAVRSEGTTVLFVEHNMEAVMKICDRLVVMDTGRKIGDGAPQEVMRDPQVVRAYLGEPAKDAAQEEPTGAAAHA